jgi:hypothetical protein
MMKNKKKKKKITNYDTTYWWGGVGDRVYEHILTAQHIPVSPATKYRRHK